MDRASFNTHAAKARKASIQFDPVEYVQYLDGIDVTDAEAREILSVLWDMMVQFVDLGFDVEFPADRASQAATPTALIADSKTDPELKTPDTGGKRP